MTKEILLDLRQFDGEGTDGSDQSAASMAGTSGTNTGDNSQGAAEAGEINTEDLDKEFDDLIRGKYKEQYKNRQQKAIMSRLKGLEADQAAMEQDKELRGTIAMRYGLGANASAADIMAAINSDDSFLEAQAAKEGLSPEQYRKMAAMQAQIDESERKLDALKRTQLQEDIKAKLIQQTEECQAVFPDFDFETEAATNEKFNELVGLGLPIIDAYKYSNMDDLMADGMGKAVAKSKDMLAAAVKNNLRRPPEAGAGNGAAATVSVDFSKMSSDEFNAYQEKLMSGEI